jgi:predicted O-methyltransferase YrrM
MTSELKTSLMDRARLLRRELAFLLKLGPLPPRVAVFQWRARRLASRIGDQFSLVSATEPEKLAALLSLAENRPRVVELGTGTGWTSISLALADPRRVVVSYDAVYRPELQRYLQLVPSAVRRRLELIKAAGDEGPRLAGFVDLLYIDSSHERASTIREVHAWRARLAEGALVVFDDFNHPDYPGVREAVNDLKLQGQERHGLFVHRVAA